MMCTGTIKRVCARFAGLSAAAALLSAAGMAGPAAASPVQVVLTLGAQSSSHSAVPGFIPGAGIPADPRFTNFNNKIYRSPNTNQWLVVATTNLTPATADQVLVIGTGLTILGAGAGSIAAREGVTATTGGEILNFSRLDTPRINDLGQWAMAYRPAIGTLSDERVVKFNGTDLVTLFKPGDAVPAVPGSVFGGSFTGASINNSGEAAFQATLDLNTGTATDQVFTVDGRVRLINLGVDMPAGQIGGPSAWSDVDSGGFTQSADGGHWLALGLVGFDPSVDRVVVVDGVVQLQKGSIIAGTGAPGLPFTSPVSTVADALMESNGNWFARGTNADGGAWVVRNGVVVAIKGQPITPGATELWESFRDMHGNNAGNWVVNGNTLADSLIDDVLVLNSSRVVARESAPVDLNANGAFEGSLFVHLVQDKGTFNNDGYYYFASRLKSTAIGTAGANGSNNASLLRVLACPADFNDSGAVSVQDIFDFLGAYFSNTPASDFNRSGATSVQDIFDFLAVYFGGC